MINIFLSLLLIWWYSILLNMISLFIFLKLVIIFILFVSIHIISYSIIDGILKGSSFLILHNSLYLLFINFIVIIILCHLILKLSLTLSWVWSIIRNLINYFIYYYSLVVITYLRSCNWSFYCFLCHVFIYQNLIVRCSPDKFLILLTHKVIWIYSISFILILMITLWRIC